MTARPGIVMWFLLNFVSFAWFAGNPVRLVSIRNIRVHQCNPWLNLFVCFRGPY
jgi:hypothetical protein